MLTKPMIRFRIFLILVLAVTGGGAIIRAAGNDTDPGMVRLLVGRSTVLDVGAPIQRVSLTSADIADALVTSPNQLLINGKMPGTISMFVWDRTGALKRYEVIVQRDLDRLSEQITQLFPKEHITVQSNGKNVVLSGMVSAKDVIDRAVDLASGYVDKRDEVVALLQLQPGAPTNQVLLRVRFAEVTRDALTELGASYFTGPNGINNQFLGRAGTEQFGNNLPQFNNDDPLHEKIVFSDFLNLFFFDQKNQLGAVLKALQSRGQFQSLAEPNLVAESGKEASFLAGGEFPVPVAQGAGVNIAITVVYKEFGIRLTFTPVVNGDRIHLKVKPEVSSLDFGNAIVLNGFRIPALTTRRTETELELENHQTFAIAGLLNNTTTKTLQKIPGIGDIPILGNLFKSQQAQKDRTELVVMITPEILPNNSPGVTPNLPRTPEEYLPSLPDKKTHEVPPPAFGASRPMSGQTIAATPAPSQPSSPAPAAAAAAATVNALTPSSPRVIEPSAADAAVVPPPQPGVRQLTPEEQKAIDRTLKQQLDKAAERARDQQKVDQQAKSSADKQAAVDQQSSKKDREKAAKEEQRRAADQAKKDKEAAKLAAGAVKQAEDAARRQADADKKQRDAIAQADAKLKAAQAVHDADVAKQQR